MNEQVNTSSSSCHLQDQTWISCLCNVPGNKFLCEVEKSFIEDSFNLYGLKQIIACDFNAAMDVILDNSEIESNIVSSTDAELLYGLIHARYILSAQGLLAMHKKYLRGDFGQCPRLYCDEQSIGISDEVGASAVKLYCPKCRDLFNPASIQRHLDGAYFGSTFPHIFFMTFEELIPIKPTKSYVPRIFGFKIHNSSKSIPSASGILTTQQSEQQLRNPGCSESGEKYEQNSKRPRKA